MGKSLEMGDSFSSRYPRNRQQCGDIELERGNGPKSLPPVSLDDRGLIFQGMVKFERIIRPGWSGKPDPLSPGRMGNFMFSDRWPQEGGFSPTIPIN